MPRPLVYRTPRKSGENCLSNKENYHVSTNGMDRAHHGCAACVRKRRRGRVVLRRQDGQDRVGALPGGGYDTYSRLFARHLGNHIPGKPKVIVINIPGGSGLIGTNYVYNVTKPDGLTLVQPSWNLAQAQFLNFPGIKYDVNKFIWLGLANAGPGHRGGAQGITDPEHGRLAESRRPRR